MIFFVARFGMFTSARGTGVAEALLPLTLVYSDACEECRFWIEDANLIPIDSEGSTVGRNVWIDGDQRVRTGRNGEDPVPGEVSHLVAGVLDTKIRVCKCECCARCEVVILRIKPLSAERTRLLVGSICSYSA